MNLHHILNRLVSRRRALGFTKTDVAEMAGISPQTLRRWETGTKPINLAQFMQLCSVYQIDPHTVLTLNDELWIASYSPSDYYTGLVGIYTTPELAQNACQLHHQQHNSSALEWTPRKMGIIASVNTDYTVILHHLDKLPLSNAT